MDTDLERDIDRLWSLLFEIVLDGEKRLAAHLANHDLTPPQFYVLKTLVEQGGQCPIGKIARLHHLTNATMTGLVKRLEAAELPLVNRQPDPDDRRSVQVILTPAGQARFIAVQADFLAQLRVVLSLLSAEERTTLLNILSRYVDALAVQFPVNSTPPNPK